MSENIDEKMNNKKYGMILEEHTYPNKAERIIFRFVIIIFCLVMFQNRLINDHEQDVVPYARS